MTQLFVLAGERVSGRTLLACDEKEGPETSQRGNKKKKLDKGKRETKIRKSQSIVHRRKKEH